MAGSALGKYFWIASSTLVLTTALTFFPSPSLAQDAPEKTSESHEHGIPVTDPLVLSKCGSCHVPDAKGNMSRISSIRTTPEGWEEAIKRMIRLNGLVISPDDARQVLRYLSDTHGLAPEEAQPVEYYAEHRQIDEKFTDPDIRHACAACHAIARPLSWRRTPEDWKLLVNMHIAYFPSIEATSFQRGGGRRAEGEGAEAPTDKRAPVDKAIEFIAKSTPLHTAAWSDWQASMPVPKLAGHWLVSGEEPGKGKFYGEMVITAGSAPEQFTTKTTLNYANGLTQTFSETGSSIVYTGFQWRGRSTPQTPGSDPGDPKAVREVMLVSKDQSEMEGRWFWGVYQEFGMEVKLRRAHVGPTVLGTDISSLHTGASAKVKIYGDHLPENVSASDIDFGAGVKVTGVDSKSPDAITVSVDVAANATPGMRTISVGEVTAPDAFAVYSHIDFLKVTPVTPIAHLGSETHPKGYAQFEAVAYSFGPDGKPDTADDINLGPVQATWKLEEFVASYGDDDIDFVGSIDPKTGFFTPGSDGPDPKRRSMRNNYGDVWAVATISQDGPKNLLSGKSYLIVAVPQYMQYDQPEVGQ